MERVHVCLVKLASQSDNTLFHLEKTFFYETQTALKYCN